ncbi:glycosyltransferase [Leptolyngbya sp. FACHB-36]|uniref:glycosyltransferase n=1 Tax=Leptolyngbya sp. FACHB-36 TaxID=2692808 RepID=UPI001681B659|nr:glycosyltransferase [Leptolyngbya sp. FACHB-36]MBD2022190.1 glycosyltransferase [Leptolyngbya sp. FACHB-36]
MPLISVIIPVFNGAKTIRDTIASVLAQSFSEFELLIINDGSTDDTLAVVSSFDDPRIQVFSYPNAGSNPSRNRGIDHARGEYISFIDADDLWTPDKLAAQRQALQAQPQAAVAYSWTDCIDEQGQYLRQGAHATIAGNVLANFLLTDCIGSGSNVLVRKSALVEVGKFDESLANAQDWDMWLRLAARYPFACVPKVQVLYRVSAGSLSSNVQRMATASFRVIERSFAQAPATLQHLKPHSLGNRYKFLTFRSLQGNPTRQKGVLALQYLWNAVRYDPTLLRTRLLWKVLLAIAVMGLLPTAQAQALIARRQRLFNLYGLLARMHLDPSRFAPSIEPLPSAVSEPS